MKKIQTKIKKIRDQYDLMLELGYEPSIVRKTEEELETQWGISSILNRKLFGYSVTMLCFIGEERGTYFFQSYTDDGYYLFDSDLGIKENEMLLLEHDKYVILDLKDLTEEKIEKLLDDKNLRGNQYLDDFYGKITPDRIDFQFLQDTITKKYEEDEKERNKELEEDKKRMKEQDKQEKNWEKSGCYENEDKEIKIVDNVLNTRRYTMTFSKPFKTFFTTLDSLRGFRYSDLTEADVIDKFMGCLNEEETGDVSVTYKNQDGLIEEDDMPQTIQIHIENRKSTFNGVEVSKTKLLSIYRNKGKNTKKYPLTTEKINALNNLGVVKLRLVGADEITIGNKNTNIPISFLPHDTKGTLIKVSVCGNEPVLMEWLKLKSTFRVSVGGASTSISPESYFEFMDELGFKTQEALEIYKEAKMLQEV